MFLGSIMFQHCTLIPQAHVFTLKMITTVIFKNIDTSTHTVTGEINTQNFPLDRPKEIVISSDGRQVYVANSGNNNVIIVNL